MNVRARGLQSPRFSAAKTTAAAEPIRGNGRDAVILHGRLSSRGSHVHAARKAEILVPSLSSFLVLLKCTSAKEELPLHAYALVRNTNTNTNTKYTCDTGQTRNKLLELWVHLTNHTAGDRVLLCVQLLAAAGRGVRLPQLILHGGGGSHGVVCVCVYVYVYVCGPMLCGVFRCVSAL